MNKRESHEQYMARRTAEEKILASDKQVGGNHYKDCAIQPIDFIITGTTNSLEFLPSYFDILDSLSTSYLDKINSLNASAFNCFIPKEILSLSASIESTIVSIS